MNKINSATTWQAICELSVRMTNGYPEDPTEGFLPGFVYMANNSVGGRNWNAVEDHRIANGFGHWLGFAEPESQKFYWESGSSGAGIRATREGGGWALEFIGREDGAEYESRYIVDFLLAADFEGAEMEGEVNNIDAILATIGGGEEFAQAISLLRSGVLTSRA